MKTGNRLRKKFLEELLRHVEYYNNLSPFPLWDSYYTNRLKKKIEMNEIDYDEEPVVCCSYCKSLHIVEDEEGNDRCFRCHNIVNDDYETFDNIHEYNKEYGNIWELNKKEDGEKAS